MATPPMPNKRSSISGYLTSSAASARRPAPQPRCRPRRHTSIASRIAGLATRTVDISCRLFLLLVPLGRDVSGGRVDDGVRPAAGDKRLRKMIVHVPAVGPACQLDPVIVQTAPVGR